jgi:hypothetical protein
MQRLRRTIVLSIVALILIVGIDYLSGFFYDNSTGAHVMVIRADQGPVRRAIVILPGYLMPGSVVAEAFKPYLFTGNALVAVNYAERGIDLHNIYSEVKRALTSLRPQAVTFYGPSMGGLVATRLAEIYEHNGLPFGKITLILDTAPATAVDVRRPSWLLELSCLYRGGIISSSLLALTSMLTGYPPDEPGANPGLVDEAHRMGAWMGMPAATSQACFIRDAQRLKRNELAGAVERVIYFQGRSAARDPVVDVSRSITQWRMTFPGLTVITLPGRSGQWHVPLVEQPSYTGHAVQLAY